VIVVRAARRPGQGEDGFDLLRRTLASVDREGGYGETKVVVFDRDVPAAGIPEHWRTVVHGGPGGSRAMLWAALCQARGASAPVLFLEDDIDVAPFATDVMLAQPLRGIPLCSFFYPVYAQPHERLTKVRRPGLEVWNIHQFGYTQAVLLSPSAIDRVLRAAHWPAPPMGGPHGGDVALRSALFAVGYDTCGVLWPNLVEHTGLGDASLVEPLARRAIRSGWFAGEARP
jgi:hypothetical protein